MSFALDLSKFSKLTEKKMETVVKKVFIGLSTDIIKGVPIDTGRARGSFLPAINKFSDEVSNTLDRSGNVTISKATSKANEYKLGDMISLTSNLPYIKRLEYGWSKQAPSGFVRLNIARFQTWVDKEARKAR